MSKKFNACVRPGVLDARANPFTPSKELIKLDFPTFERPTKEISGRSAGGQCSSAKALFKNTALVTFIAPPG
jgi:hypothetical protein